MSSLLNSKCASLIDLFIYLMAYFLVSEEQILRQFHAAKYLQILQLVKL